MKHQEVFLKKIKTILNPIVEFWLPRKSLSFELHTSLYSYVAAQITVFVISLFASENMDAIAGLWAQRVAYGYSCGVVASLLFLRLGFILSVPISSIEKHRHDKVNENYLAAV